MRVLLTIGHLDVLLPDDKGLATIMKALSNAIEVYDHLYEKEPRLEFRSELRLEIKMVPRSANITGLPTRQTKPKALNPPTSILL